MWVNCECFFLFSCSECSVFHTYLLGVESKKATLKTLALFCRNSVCVLCLVGMISMYVCNLGFLTLTSPEWSRRPTNYASFYFIGEKKLSEASKYFLSFHSIEFKYSPDGLKKNWLLNLLHSRKPNKKAC